MQKISPQNKTNLKQRVLTLMNGLKERVDFSFNFEYTGSIKNPGEMKINSDGFYDIDIDIKTSTTMNAQDTYSKIKTAINDYSLRYHESTKSKTNAVICIIVDEPGHKYKIDIAIFNLNGGKSQKMQKSGQSYVWSQ